MTQRNSITSTTELTISDEYKVSELPENSEYIHVIEDTDEYDDETHPDMKLPPGGKYALAVLTGINLLNYIDRYVPSATKDLFKADLHLSDTETSAPLTAFLVIYMISAPIFGSLCDRGFSRKILICIGIIIWSLSTAAAYFATDFWSFLICRTIVGIGESAYGTIAPALLSDFYPKSKRNKVLTIFYIAIPVGAALGYGIGGEIGGSLGWRYAFLICGLPGVLFAFLCLKIQDPGRGIWEKSKIAEQTIPWKDTLLTLAKNRMYVIAVLGYMTITFAAGGMADWLPTYMHRENGADIDNAGLLVGAATVVGGLGGTISGGYIAEKLKSKTRLPYLAVSGVALVPSTVLAFVMLYAIKSEYGVAAVLLFCQLFLWCYSGPINTTIANSVSVTIRARAFSLSILITHLGGDAISPLIIGAISDSTGSLKSAVILVPITIGISCVIWLFAWRLLPEKKAEDTVILV